MWKAFGIGILCGQLLAPLVLAETPNEPTPSVYSTDPGPDWQEMLEALHRVTSARARSPESKSARIVDKLTWEDCARPEQVELALWTANFTFQRLKGNPTPGEFHVQELRQNLWRLASYAPEAYRTLMADADLRGKLLATERLFGVQLFASDESNAQALRIILELQLLAAQDLRDDGPSSKEEAPMERTSISKRQITSKRVLLACLRGAAAALKNSIAVPVPKVYAADLLVNAFRFVGPRLFEESRHRGGELAGNLVGYVSNESHWLAYRLFAEQSPNDVAKSKLAVRMGERFLQSSCTSTSTSTPATEYMCLNVLSLLSGHYAGLGNSAEARSAKQRLDTMIGQSARLKFALSTEDGKSQVLAERWQTERRILVDFIPRLDDMASGSPELDLARFHELRAISHWLLIASRSDMQALIGLLTLIRVKDESDSDFPSVMVVAAGISRALEMQDAQAAFTGIELIRRTFESMLQELENSSDNTAGVLATHAQLLLMELGAQLVTGNREKSAKVAMRIRETLAPMLMNKMRDSSARAVVESCAKPEPDSTTQLMSAEMRQMQAIDAQAARVQIQLNVERGVQVPLAALYATLAWDLRQLFAPETPQGPRFRQGHKDDDEESSDAKPLSPSEFMQGWSIYSRAFGAHRSALQPVAVAVKCRLSSADFQARLTADFAGKNAQGREQLSRAILQLIGDSGRMRQKRSAVTEGDFRLLQLASSLSAQDGLSAAAARSVFPNDGVRERVQRAEARLAVQRNSMTTLLELADMVKAMRGREDLFEMLKIALEYPTAYALYSELKGQRVIGLDEVKQALAGNEAVVQFVPAGDQLLAVVVRQNQAILIKLQRPAATLRPAVASLLASMQLPASGGQALPPKFRTDLAWLLHQHVWQLLEASLKGAKTIYLVPGEALAGVPFQALLRVRPPTLSRINYASYRKLAWLGEKYAFVSLPSLHSLLRARVENEPTDSPKLFGVGEPTIPSAALRAMQLEGTPETARLLKRSAKPGDPEPLLGARATYSELALKSSSGIPGQADIILINSHTLPAVQAERFGARDASIILAPSGSANTRGADILSPEKVLELKLPVRLAMLLSCETAGIGPEGSREPFAGLVNSFFFAGARSVLSALRPVSSAATEELAASFLRQFRDNRLPAAVALQRAAAEVRCSDNESPCAEGVRSVWGHPAYWAQFLLVGSGR